MRVNCGRLVVGTDGGTSVVLRDPRRGDEGWTYFAVELHGAGLDVDTGVMFHRMQPFAAFWREMEADWKGWPSERRWDSTEPGLSVTAHHDGLHIRTLWTAVGGAESCWRASLELLIEPGEQLSAIARDVEDLLGRA